MAFTSSTAPTTTTTLSPSGVGVTVVGDSVMLDAAPYLQGMLPGIAIDAQVGQQLTQVQGDAAALKAAGAVGDELVVELGTNGYYSVTQLETLLRTFGPMRRTVLINTRETRPWEQAVNQTIATVASSWPDTVLIDWYTISAPHPEYFYTDGVHLNPVGAQAYADLIVAALEAPPPRTTTTTTTQAPRTKRGSHATAAQHRPGRKKRPHN
jgi:hypothetical protein